MVAKTSVEKEALVKAKANYKELVKNREKYNFTLNGILTAFSNSLLPKWGSFVFNGQRV